MIFSDKLYVGFQRGRYYGAGSEPRVLGFAVPYGDTKAQKKRIETVDLWREDNIEPRIIDNDPVSGFKILHVVNRYQGNKVVRILDPRGFELEISVVNLIELLQENTVVNGEIIAKCSWAQDHGAYLVTERHPEYLAYKNVQKKGKPKITEGNYYKDPSNAVSVFRYEGIYHQTYLDIQRVCTEATPQPRDRAYYWHRQQYYVTDIDLNVTILMNSGKKPSYVYTEFILDSEGNVSSSCFHIRKSHFKNLIESDEEITDDMKETQFNPMTWVNTERTWGCDYNLPRINSASHGTLTCPAFFKDKQEAKNFDYGHVIQNLDDYSRYGIDTSKFAAGNRFSFYNDFVYAPKLNVNRKIEDKR